MNGAAKETITTPQAAVPTTHPTGFFFIFWGEFAERCCYYGMRAILFVYLTQILKYSDPDATSLYSYFKAACYLLPLLGGFLADRYFGKYNTIVSFSVFYVIGLFVLCIPTREALILALILMACGSGVIKPNISTLMGLTYDQKRPGQLELRSAGFRWFYFSVNIGALVSMLFLPIIRKEVTERSGNPTLGFQVAFVLPAILMVIALAVFALGKKHYAVEVRQTRELTPEEKRERWNVLGTLFGVFALMVFFWMAYEQNDNLWIAFIRDNVNTNLNLGFTSYTFANEGFQFVNSACVLLFIPIFNWFFRRVDPMGTRISPMAKMLAGFILTGLAFGVMALAAKSAQGGEKVSAWWIVWSYVVLTIGEVLVYGTGLELSFAAAPATMKSFVTACFLMTNTLGNLLNSVVSQLYNQSTAVNADDSVPLHYLKKVVAGLGVDRISPQAFYMNTLYMMLIASLVFYFVGRRFDRKPSAVEASPEA